MSVFFRYLVKSAVIPVLILFSGTVAFATQTVGDSYPEFASGMLGAAELETLDEGTVLVSGDFTITEAELQEIMEKQKPEIVGQLKKNLFFILEQETTRRVLANQAKKAGIDVGRSNEESIFQELFNQKIEVDVTDDELTTFYEANSEMVGEVPFEAIKEDIRQYLMEEKRRQAAAAYLSALMTSIDFRIDTDWLEGQYHLSLDNPVDRARRSKKPTMVEFGATGCIPCDMMQPILENLEKNHGDTLNVVFVHVGEQQLLASRYDIRSIPVQVFFDSEGREVFRHVGFFAETEVAKQLAQMGITK